MKAKCYKCKKILTFTSELGMPSNFVLEGRDIDGTDVFSCGCIRGLHFKLNLPDYIKNKGKKNFIAKTVNADLDYSNGIDKIPKKKIKRSPLAKAKRFLGL